MIALGIGLAAIIILILISVSPYGSKLDKNWLLYGIPLIILSLIGIKFYLDYKVSLAKIEHSTTKR